MRNLLYTTLIAASLAAPALAEPDPNSATDWWVHDIYYTTCTHPALSPNDLIKQALAHNYDTHAAFPTSIVLVVSIIERGQFKWNTEFDFYLTKKNCLLFNQINPNQ